MPQPIAIATYRTAKLGESAEACEDVIGQQRRSENGNDYVRVALSDGATMSSFARRWAELLTHFFVHRHLSSPAFYEEAAFARALRIMRQAWRARLPSDLPWHSEVKVAEGAAATLLGVEVVVNGEGARWNALAVGDTCLLQYDGKRIMHAFPIAKSEEFAYTPELLLSAPETRIPVPLFAAGSLSDGDVLVLATDALAKYLLEHDGEVDPAELAGGDRCAERLDALRADGTMKNDDIAIALLRSAES